MLLLYGAKKRALTSKLMDVLCRCDCWMPRYIYIAGVRWQEGRSNSGMEEMCGVEDFWRQRGSEVRVGDLNAGDPGSNPHLDY